MAEQLTLAQTKAGDLVYLGEDTKIVDSLQVQGHVSWPPNTTVLRDCDNKIHHLRHETKVYMTTSILF